LTRSGKKRSKKFVLFVLAFLLSIRSCGPRNQEPGIGDRFAQLLREVPSNIEKNVREKWIVEGGEAFEKYSRDFKIDPDFLERMIREESRLKVYACNTNTMARGLMQLTYIALVEFCLHNPGYWKILFYYDYKGELMRDENGRLLVNKYSVYCPKINILVGGWLFRHLRKKYKGDEGDALVAYCAGEGNLNSVRFAESRYRDRIIPPKKMIEVDAMVKAIIAAFALFFLLSVVNLYLAWRINGRRNIVGPTRDGRIANG